MINFNNRLTNLKDRRQGTRERVLIENNLSRFDSRDFRTKESYEQLAESASIRYTIGAMAEVARNSTEISIQEGERVADTLISMLRTIGINATKEIQGSVALNIHIEGHSDVDMLILKDDIVLVQTPKLDGSACVASDKRPMKDIIRELRLESENKLTTRYHQADVNCSGNKSIAISGGSLKRKVDIVPACWYHTHDYQTSGQKHDMEMQVYHKADHELIGNKPFMHMKKVNDKDSLYPGNLKKVIRLMKNLVADMPDYKKNKVKRLSSYDLTALAFTMDEQLSCPSYMSLALVERLRSHLSLLVASEGLRNQLTVPDGSRKVFDKPEKLEALQVLYNEVDELARAIYNSLRPLSEREYNPAELINKHVYI